MEIESVFVTVAAPHGSGTSPHQISPFTTTSVAVEAGVMVSESARLTPSKVHDSAGRMTISVASGTGSRTSTRAVSNPGPPLISTSASSSCANSMSSPLEATSRSTPVPPTSVSFPSPAARMSLPSPPSSRSVACSPRSSSLPGPPWIESGSELPRRSSSLPGPPVSTIGPRKWRPAPLSPRPLK